MPVITCAEYRCKYCDRLLGHQNDETFVVRHKGREFFVCVPGPNCEQGCVIKLPCPRCGKTNVVKMGSAKDSKEA
jgi:ssDNA-binding Zn-finger/Zn-ribbon topoisomerase 1